MSPCAALAIALAIAPAIAPDTRPWTASGSVEPVLPVGIDSWRATFWATSAIAP
jgi:hypothetical protein